jgi:hypothetical protein
MLVFDVTRVRRGRPEVTFGKPQTIDDGAETPATDPMQGRKAGSSCYTTMLRSTEMGLRFEIRDKTSNG